MFANSALFADASVIVFISLRALPLATTPFSCSYLEIISCLNSFALCKASNPASPVVDNPATKYLCPLLSVLYPPAVFRNESDKPFSSPNIAEDPPPPANPASVAAIVSAALPVENSLDANGKDFKALV